MIQDIALEPTVHATAVVEDGVELGPGAMVEPFACVQRGAKVGGECLIGHNVLVAGGAVIGERSQIQSHASLYEGVTLEADVFCGPSVVVADVNRPRAGAVPVETHRPTHVGCGATLGASCTVLGGVQVGRYAMVGAGAVVTRDVPDFALVYGVPARQHGWVCRCGTRLAMGRRNGICHACGTEYRLTAPGTLVVSS